MHVDEVFPRWGRQLEEFRPQVVVLMVGDNDIHRHVNIRRLSHEILSTAAHFLSPQFGARMVLVCQMMPRFPGVYPYDPDYNDLARELNEVLASSLQGEERLFFWTHEFVAKNSIDEIHQKYILDGTHLNDYGHAVLYSSIKTDIHVRKYLAPRRW